MIKKKKIFPLLLLLTASWAHGFCQWRGTAYGRKVLLNNEKSKAFVFKEHHKEYGTILFHATYIGAVALGIHKNKMVIYSYVSGMAHNAKSWLWVFDGHNNYLGNYAGFMMDELPNDVINNKLVFVNRDTACSPINSKHEIDFSAGIPSKFSIACGKYIAVYHYQPAAAQ